MIIETNVIQKILSKHWEPSITCRNSYCTAKSWRPTKMKCVSIHPKCTCTYKHHQTTIQQKQPKTFEVSWLATGAHKLCWAYNFFRSRLHLCLV